VSLVFMYPSLHIQNASALHTSDCKTKCSGACL